MAINEHLNQSNAVLDELANRLWRDMGGSTTTVVYNINVTSTAPANWGNTGGGPQHSGGPHHGFHRDVNNAVRREMQKAQGG